MTEEQFKTDVQQSADRADVVVATLEALTPSASSVQDVVSSCADEAEKQLEKKLRTAIANYMNA